VLLQIRYEDWVGDVAYRRGAYDISTYFLLPAMMSLGSLLAGEQPTIWRASFALMGALGVLESALLIAGMRGVRARGPLVTAIDWVSLLVYALVVVVALWSRLPQDVGLGLRPLEAEGILIAVLLFIGIALGARLFVTAGPAVDAAGEPRGRVG
jgi:hypothetical protein